MDMSRASRIVALIIAIAFVAVGVIFMVQRIGSVIGWDKASNGWPIIALLAGLILLIAFLVYMSVRNKLNR
jgi:divalent metal cation (Fe/Co/Zn/Cd) transporter